MILYPISSFVDPGNGKRIPEKVTSSSLFSSKGKENQFHMLLFTCLTYTGFHWHPSRHEKANPSPRCRRPLSHVTKKTMSWRKWHFHGIVVWTTFLKLEHQTEAPHGPTYQPKYQGGAHRTQTTHPSITRMWWASAQHRDPPCTLLTHVVNPEPFFFNKKISLVYYVRVRHGFAFLQKARLQGFLMASFNFW
jgi:hypothetical protein